MNSSTETEIIQPMSQPLAHQKSPPRTGPFEGLCVQGRDMATARVEINLVLIIHVIIVWELDL